MKLILMTILLAAICSCSAPQEVIATVIDKVYSPSSVSSGVGTTLVNGKIGAANTTSFEGERYMLIVKDSLDTYSVQVTAGEWATLNQGDSIKVSKAWHGKSLVK